MTEDNPGLSTQSAPIVIGFLISGVALTLSAKIVRVLGSRVHASLDDVFDSAFGFAPNAIEDRFNRSGGPDGRT